MATENIISKSMVTLPYIIYTAKSRDLITYGDLAKLVGVHHRVIAHILGYIRDEICRKKGLPLINAIVVNGISRLPGESFLPEGTGHLSKEEYKKAFEKHRDKVFICNKWDELHKELRLQPIKMKDIDFVEIGIKYSELQARRSSRGGRGGSNGGGEGERHLALKEFIMQNPSFLGLRRCKAQDEYPFPSGDRSDIVFDLGKNEYAIVEVKTGDKGLGELACGIYQVIKYQALLCATKGLGKSSVKCFLVAYDMSEDIVKHASRFGIKTKLAPSEF